MRAFLSFSIFLVYVTAFVVAGNLEVLHKSSFSRRHGHAREILGSLANRNASEEGVGVATRGLEKRFEGMRFTFYDAGLGACGRYNANSDFVVALNVAQYEGGAHCFAPITIIINGKTASASIADLCPGCPYGGLDFSRGLFNYFSSESAGVLTGAWYFGDAPAASPTTTSSTPTPTPTSAVQPSTTSSSTISSSVVSSTSSSSSSASHASSTSSAADALKSTLPYTMPEGNLSQLALAFLSIGGIELAAVH